MGKKVVAILAIASMAFFITNGYSEMVSHLNPGKTVQDEPLRMGHEISKADVTAQEKTGQENATTHALQGGANQEKSLMDHKATVFKVEGDVRFLKKGTTLWKTLAAGETVKIGDQIRTGKSSFAEIHFDDFYLNTARIEENTVAEFQAIEPTRIHLSDGSIYNVLDGLPKNSSYQVSTPTSVAGVRGTRFIRMFDAVTKTDQTLVSHGVVDVYPIEDRHGTINQEKVIRVKAGMGLFLDPEKIKSGHMTPAPLKGERQKSLNRTTKEMRRNLLEHVGRDQVIRNTAAWKRVKTKYKATTDPARDDEFSFATEEEGVSLKLTADSTLLNPRNAYDRDPAAPAADDPTKNKCQGRLCEDRSVSGYVPVVRSEAKGE